MALAHSPSIATNGLVLCLDAGNVKGFDSSENLLAYSEDFSNAYWTKSNVSVTANAITSPTGSSNASKLVESASTAVHELFSSDATLFVGTDTYITFSIFAKAAERQYCYIRSTGNSKRIAVVVDLSNGTFNVGGVNSFTINSSATVTPYPNGWYRITVTAQSNYPLAPGWSGIFIVSPLDSYQLASNVGGVGYSYAGDGTSGIYIWGATYEFGPGISNYYPTTGTAKSRGTTVADLSGRGNNGTLTNGPTYSSANGGSIVFDGTNDNIQLGNTSNIVSASQSQITVNAWVKTNVVEVYKKILVNVATGTASITGIYFSIGPSPYNTYFGVTTSGGQDRATYTQNISTTSYVNLCGTYDGSNIRLYLNGTLVATQALTGTLGTGGITRISGYDDSTETWNGNIAQVSVYNRALTEAEIQQNFNALRGRFGI